MTTSNPQSVTTRLAGAALSAMLFLQIGGSAIAQDYRYMSCDELWYARNAIYANKGYCFESERAIRAFGPSCFPPFGRLNSYERREVRDIQRWERRKGC